MDAEALVQICKEALYEAHRTIENIGSQGTSEVYDARVSDISTKGDRAVSKALIDLFKKRNIPAVIYSEESGKIDIVDSPKYVISFDDIDGTNNYHRGREILPFCTVISIFDSCTPCFKDVLAAGIIEHNSGKLWIAIRNKGCYLNDSKVKTSGARIIDRKKVMVCDNYTCGANVSRFSRLYERLWVKDFSSAALHFAGVSSGVFDCYLSPSQKAHELGAGYLLVKEAGGFLSDLEGNSLDDMPYNFDAKYPIIAASSEELGKELLKGLNNKV